MLTKEELLQKGISESVADEIISAFSEEEDNSLQALQKALDDDPAMDDLIKADGGDSKNSDDEKDDYDESYMKKYMKRYMKENKKSCGKMMKDLGESGDDMKKAVDNVDLDSEGAIVEMTDLAPFLKDQAAFNEKMVKAVSELAESIDLISAKTEKNYDLMQKAAKVQVEQATELDKFLNVSEGRKGVVADVKMSKATDAAKFSPEDNKIIYKSLMKAVKDGDQMAGQVISAFESGGQNANRLNPSQKQFINELISQEAK